MRNSNFVGGLLMSLLVALLLQGCLMSSNIPGDPADVIPPADESEEAFFILQQTHLQGSDWPEAFAHYSMFICNPALTASELATVRADIPGAKLLAYTSAQDIWIDNYPGNPYFEAMADAFPPQLCIKDLNNGQVVHIYGYGGPSPVAAFIPREASVNALVSFHNNYTMLAPWDGFYIDQCTRAYPNHRKATLLSITSRFDIDNNGFADSMTLLEVRYAEGRALFTQRMRATFPNKILIGNSGGALGDPALNGITLEGVGDRFTVDEARLILDEQKLAGVYPFRSVLWHTTELSGDPSRRLSLEMAGVYYGVVEAAVNAAALRVPTLRFVPLPPDRLKDSGGRQSRALDD